MFNLFDSVKSFAESLKPKATKPSLFEKVETLAKENATPKASDSLSDLLNNSTDPQTVSGKDTSTAGPARLLSSLISGATIPTLNTASNIIDTPPAGIPFADWQAMKEAGFVKQSPVSGQLDKLAESTKKNFTVPDQNFPEQIASAVGSSLPIAAASLPMARAFGVPGALATGTVLESKMEGTEAKRRALEKGMTPAEAQNAEDFAFNINLPLLGVTNSLGPVREIAKLMAGKKVTEGAIKGALKGFATEAPQEAIQTAVGNQAVNDPLGQGVAESGLVGGTVGALFGGGAGMSNVQETKKELQKISEIPQEIKKSLDNAGIPRMTGARAERGSTGVKEEKNLVAMHNLDAENLIHADRMGGLAVPSLSIGKADHPLEGFGDITLIGNKELIDPKKSSNKVFNADIYSPRYPEVKYDVDSKALKEIRKDLSKEEADLGRTLGSDIDSGSFTYKGIEALQNSPILRLKYLRSIGKDVVVPKNKADTSLIDLNPKIEKFIDGELIRNLYSNKEFLKEYETTRIAEMKDAEQKALLAGDTKKEAKALAEEYGKAWYDEDGKPNYNVIRRMQDQIELRKRDGQPDYYAADREIQSAISEHKEDFNNWINNNYSKIIGKEKLYNGEDRNYNQKYLPHNLENVVRVMKRSLQSGEGFNYGLGNVRASVAKRYKSIKEIQSDRNKILSKEEFEKVKEFTDKEFDDIIAQAYDVYEHKDRGGIADTFTTVLIDGIKNNALESDLKEYGFGRMDIDRIKAFLGVIKDMPSEYFEAKMQRAVGLSEFSGAIIPIKTSDKAIRILERNNIPYVKYDPNKEGDRSRAIKEFNNKYQEKSILFEKQDELFTGKKVEVGEKVNAGDYGEALKGILNKYVDISDNLVFVKYIKDENGFNAAGMYFDKVISLLPNSTLETAMHELKHYAFDIFLSPEEKRTLIESAKRYYGIRLSKKENETDFNYHKRIDTQAMEYLAREFVKYINSKKRESVNTGFINKVKNLFNKMIERIEGFLKTDKSRIEQFYNDILSKKFKGAKELSQPGELQAPQYSSEWSDEPMSKEERAAEIQKIRQEAGLDREKISIEDKAQLELEIMASGNIHPLEKAMQGYKLRPYKNGVETEEYMEIPARFRSKDGSAIDDARTEIEGNTGISFNSDSEFIAALKALGNQPKRFNLSNDVQTYLKNQKNVALLEEKLAKKISPKVIKRIINSYVGVKKEKTDIIIQTTEQQVLRHMLKVREKASVTGYKAGIAEIKEMYKNKSNDLNTLKRVLTDYIRSNLPPEVRFKLIPDIRDLNTDNDLGNAILKVEKIKEQLDIKQKAIEDAKRFTPQQRKELYQKAYSKGLIIKLDSGKHKDKLVGLLRYYKDASFDELKSYINELQGAVGNPPLVIKLYGDINADTEALKLINEQSKNWRDINSVEIRTLDMNRIIEKVTGRDSWDSNILYDNFYNVIAGADAARFDRMNDELKELYSNNEGILKDTKKSAELMQKFEAEESLTASELKVVSFLRSKYNELIKEANEVRQKLGKKPIPYRNNYMAHIRDQNLLNVFFKGDLGKAQEISNEQLDAIRKGDFSKGNMAFNKFAQKRLGKKTKFDAIGNYEQYLETLLYEIYMTPAVTHARKFAEYSLLRLPNAYEASNMLLNELAGKPSSLDKLLKPIVSNSLVKFIRQRIASNALVGNISFNLLNIANLSTSVGELGVYSVKGANAFLSNKALRDLAFSKSSVQKSRRGQFDADVKAISVFNPNSFLKLTPLEQARVGKEQLKYLVEGITRAIEYFNVGSTWTGAYLKAIDKFKFSEEKALKYADTIAKRTQVGYRSYELPAAMRSDTGKLFLQFQSWTFNAMNHLVYDMKLGNAVNPIKNKITNDNLPTNIEYRKLFVLIGVLMLVNELYKRQGWREPTSIASAIPRVSFPAKKLITDFGTSTGADNAIRVILGEKPVRHEKETVDKARKRLLLSNIVPFGGTQVARLAEGNVLPDNSKYRKAEAVDMYEKALRTEDSEKFKKLLKEANDFAGKNNVLIDDAIDSAERRVRSEIIDLYEEAIRNSDRKLIDKADKIGAVAGFSEKEMKKMESSAEKRIEKGTDKEVMLAAQKEEYAKNNPSIFNRVKSFAESIK